MKLPDMSTEGIPEVPDHGDGEGQAREENALATAEATTNVKQLDPAGKSEGEQRAEADLDADRAAHAPAADGSDLVDAWMKYGGKGPMP